MTSNKIDKSDEIIDLLKILVNQNHHIEFELKDINYGNYEINGYEDLYDSEHNNN